MKIPKCPKSVTGKHKFIKMHNGVLWGDFFKWECANCGMVDDRIEKT